MLQLWKGGKSLWICYEQEVLFNLWKTLHKAESTESPTTAARNWRDTVLPKAAIFPARLSDQFYQSLVAAPFVENMEVSPKSCGWCDIRLGNCAGQLSISKLVKFLWRHGKRVVVTESVCVVRPPKIYTGFETDNWPAQFLGRRAASLGCRACMIWFLEVTWTHDVSCRS